MKILFSICGKIKNIALICAFQPIIDSSYKSFKRVVTSASVTKKCNSRRSNQGLSNKIELVNKYNQINHISYDKFKVFNTTAYFAALTLKKH